MSDNNTNTLNGALLELGETLAENLNSMGVSDANANDGLTTLANKILNINPSLTGVELSTALTCTLSEDMISTIDSVTVSGVLSASYDDTSQSNVDLNGFLQGATVTIYNGNTVLGTAITNSSGFYSFNYSPLSEGVYSIHASFSGTDDYNSCNSSNVSLNVEDVLWYGFSGTYPFTIFDGRNVTYLTVDDTTLTQTSGSKGGGHSKITIFEESGDYEVSFRILESTMNNSNGVRIGIHSANSSTLEQSCIGVAHSADSNHNVNFEYANNNVSVVTKYNTGLTSLDYGDIVKFCVEGTTLKAYVNDVMYVSVTMDWLHEPMWIYVQSWGTNISSISIDKFKVKKIKGE